MRALPATVDVAVVGVSFQPGYPDTLLEMLREEHAGIPRVLCLYHELDNPVDDLAVAVMIEDGLQRVGHLPASVAARIAPELDDGVHWEVEHWTVQVHPARPEQPGLGVRCRRTE
jgi:hypothetical protein